MSGLDARPPSVLPLRRLSILLACAALSACALNRIEGLDARIDAIVDREHAAGRLDGVVLVGRDDSVAYRGAVGLADRESGRPHRVDETWRLASFSKQVAALIAMQQVEQGRLTLESTLVTLLPDFGSPSASLITVRQLLEHTSGLPNPDATSPAGAPPDAMPPYYTAVFGTSAGPLNAALVYCSGPPVSPPGARFSYNNCDTLVLQAVLERSTGRSYAHLVDEAVARPLKLASFALMVEGLQVEMPKGYVDTGLPEPHFNLATFGASGALVGSAGDVWRFDSALMGRRLLGDSATREMWTGDPRLGHVALGAWSFEAPLPGCGKPVALIERRGEIGGVQVRNLIAPEAKAAVIVLSNTSKTEFGEVWQGRGLLHELAAAAFCG